MNPYLFFGGNKTLFSALLRAGNPKVIALSDLRDHLYVSKIRTKNIEPWKIPFSEFIEEGEETGWIHGYKWNIVISCDKCFYRIHLQVCNRSCIVRGAEYQLKHAHQRPSSG